MPNKAIFFDRDGVINEIILRDGGHYSPRQFSDFYLKAGIKEFIGQVKKMEYLTIVTTNQPDIARGLMNQDELDKMHNLMRKELNLDEIIVCPHDNHHNCDCRKPKPGMILNAAKKWNIALDKSFIIGDTNKDTESGRNAGVKTIILDTSYNQGTEADYRVKSFEEIIEIIKK